jgi:hypothetical protein
MTRIDACQRAAVTHQPASGGSTQLSSAELGAQAWVDDDERYQGSRYAEVRAALRRNAYYLTWGQEGEPPLPVYGVTLGRVLRGAFRRWLFHLAAARAIDSSADLRWGPDGRGFRRLLHPNGVALFGRWIIDQPTEYTGYFSEGRQGLIIGRYSTCCSETRRGYTRSLSLVGKIYPTQDEEHQQLLKPAHFITQEDLGGAETYYINDALLRNAPDVTPWRRGWGFPILLLTSLAFRRVDREITVRQLYQIAELGKESSVVTRCPKFMQLTVADTQPRIRSEELDFRDEVLEQIYDRGDRVAKRSLVMNIEVADESIPSGALRTRREFPNGWRRIGQIEFVEAVASYNSDFVLHFQHPAWRTDVNEPETTVRRGGRRR